MNRWKRTAPGQRGGFTLVEILVAMIVGSVAVIALASVMMSTSQLQWLALGRSEMVTLAERQLDELRSFAALRTPDTVRLRPGGSLTASVTNYNQQMTSARGRVYDVRWLVTAGLNGTRNVTVRVSPATTLGKELSRIDVTTLILIE